MSHWIDIPGNPEKLQRALKAAHKTSGESYYTGKIDGILAGKSALAIRLYRRDNRLGDRPVVDAKLLDHLKLREPEMNNTSNNWLSGIVTSTAGQYILAMIATFIASKLGVDKGDVTAILVQVIGIVPMIYGMWQASRSKVVVNGTVVPLSHMPEFAKDAVVDAAATVKPQVKNG
jgi:hypothetical protein